MPKPYPREFRGDVVRVARPRDVGVTLDRDAVDEAETPFGRPSTPSPPRGKPRPTPDPIGFLRKGCNYVNGKVGSL